MTNTGGTVLRVEEAAFGAAEAVDDFGKQEWEQLGEPIAYGLQDYMEKFIDDFQKGLPKVEDLMAMEENAYQTGLGFLIICLFVAQLPYTIVTCICTKYVVSKNKKHRK